jgi:microcystin-dependent protein
LALVLVVCGGAAQAQTTQWKIGQLILVAGNACPQGALPADGRQLPINRNQALFALIGTTYGGDGRETFALPDLRKVPVPGALQCVVVDGIFPSRD